MPTENHQRRLARRWAQRHHAELTRLGWVSLTDPAGTVYTLEQLTFAVFPDKSIRWQYITALYRLGERRNVRSVPQFAIEEHTRRLRRWVREQFVQAHRSTVMVEAR